MPKSNIASIVAKDALTSTKEITFAGKSFQKMNGHKKNETINDSTKYTDQENGTNSGHSSSNESNNIDKRKKSKYLLCQLISFYF